eukprot:gene26369-biopygen16141
MGDLSAHAELGREHPHKLDTVIVDDVMRTVLPTWCSLAGLRNDLLSGAISQASKEQCISIELRVEVLSGERGGLSSAKESPSPGDSFVLFLMVSLT